MHALGILIERAAAVAKELQGTTETWVTLRKRELALMERNVAAQERLALATQLQVCAPSLHVYAPVDGTVAYAMQTQARECLRRLDELTQSPAVAAKTEVPK